MTHGEQIKEKIIKTGVALWAVEKGISASRIARELGMVHSAVLYHFGNVDALVNALAAHALATNESRVIVHLMAMRHPSIANLSAADQMTHLHRAAL